MTTKHTATSDVIGRIKRNSKSRVYSHAVIIHFKLGEGPTCGYRVEWASTAALANRNARIWANTSHVARVEILDAIAEDA